MYKDTNNIFSFQINIKTKPNIINKLGFEKKRVLKKIVEVEGIEPSS